MIFVIFFLWHKFISYFKSVFVCVCALLLRVIRLSFNKTFLTVFFQLWVSLSLSQLYCALGILRMQCYTTNLSEKFSSFFFLVWEFRWRYQRSFFSPFNIRARAPFHTIRCHIFPREVIINVLPSKILFVLNLFSRFYVQDAHTFTMEFE